jgi:hypothetical protein
MNFKKTVLVTAITFSTLTINASSTSDDELLYHSSKNRDWGWYIEWLLERAYKYLDRKTYVYDPNTMRFAGDVYFDHLSYNSHIAGLSLAACGTDKGSKWHAPWLTEVSKSGKVNTDVLWVGGGYSRTLDKYVVTTGTPYEIVSKNFKRAGIKRFYDFRYSWMISDSHDYTVIHNLKKHGYKVDHVFQDNGTKLLTGVIFSNYDAGGEISFGGKSNGDGTYTWDKPKFKFKWRRDMGVYGCGAVQVNVEKNTAPVINSVSFYPCGGRGSSTIYYCLRIDSYDKHSSKESLKRDWTFYLDGRVLDRPLRYFEISNLSPERRKTYRYKVVVSDGELSTVKEGIVP